MKINMGHDKSLTDGKKRRDPLKSIKERRADKKAKHEDSPHARNRPRWKKAAEV